MRVIRSVADKKSNRTKLYVDEKVQGTLLLRVLLYFFGCTLFVVIPVVISYTLSDPSRLFYQHLGEIWNSYCFAIIIAVCMLPFLIYDILKISHRFVGPILRLRSEMRQLADGSNVQDLSFRTDDYWHDLAASFNEIARELREVRNVDGSVEDEDGKQQNAVCRTNDNLDIVEA